MRYVHRPLALCAICFLLLPAAAHGQRDAQLDPDSPAGVEYQLPLEQARKNLSPSDGDGPGSEGGRGSGGGRGEGLASLFGAGIVPIKDGSGAQEGGDRGNADPAAAQGSSGSDRAGGDQGRDGAGAGSGAAALRQPALGASDEDGGSAALPIAGIALAVLAVGGLLGLALRRGLGQLSE